MGQIAVRGLASGSNDPYTTFSALDLSRVALVPLVQRDEAPGGRVDDDGAVRLLFAWPSAESLIGDAFDRLRQYGLEHPGVVRAALDLAARLGAEARTDAMRALIAGRVEDLLRAYADPGADAPDLATIRGRGRTVLDGLATAG